MITSTLSHAINCLFHNTVHSGQLPWPIPLQGKSSNLFEFILFSTFDLPTTFCSSQENLFISLIMYVLSSLLYLHFLVLSKSNHAFIILINSGKSSILCTQISFIILELSYSSKNELEGTGQKLRSTRSPL